MSSFTYLWYIRVEGIPLPQTKTLWCKGNQTKIMSTKTQLETLLLRSNNFNNSDFQIQYFGVDIQPNNCELYSNSLDIVIGENYYPEEGKWIISKNGECLGVFQNDREVINFIINLNK